MTYWRSDLPHSRVELAFGWHRNLEPFGRLLSAAIIRDLMRLAGQS